jgi:hypothetical protein
MQDKFAMVRDYSLDDLLGHARQGTTPFIDENYLQKSSYFPAPRIYLTSIYFKDFFFKYASNFRST